MVTGTRNSAAISSIIIPSSVVPGGAEWLEGIASRSGTISRVGRPKPVCWFDRVYE
jgi:hypothetical protein